MRQALLALTFIALSTPALAASGLGDIEIFDRTAGRALPVHQHKGRSYVVGEPQHQYELRIRNRSGGRVLAVTSVDGVNVVTGETAAEGQGGYVIDPTGQTVIDGWRKSLDEVATFYFTSLGDSYAARTGRPRNVGVIGVALFRERETPCCSQLEQRSDRGARAPAPAAEGAASGTADRDSARRESQSKLGTGHGHRESSAARYVDFERRSKTPDQTIVIYYDSRQNLIAQGVIPSRPALADRRPNPFPNGFVPDP